MSTSTKRKYDRELTTVANDWKPASWGILSNMHADVVAYVDEAGEKGLSRNLAIDRDSGIGLMCCLIFPAERLQEFASAYQNGFDRFCAASPTGEKIHITDAFRPGNDAWAQVARGVREEFFELIRQQQIPVIYDARRLSLQREDYERVEELKKTAKEAKRSPICISERPSDDRVEGQLIEGLTLKLDALATDLDRARVDLCFDEVDTVSFPLFFVFQPVGIMPPISAHAEC